MTTYFSSTCLLEDKKGNIWFGTYNGGIYKYIMSESRMEVIDLPKIGVSSNWVTCLTEDKTELRSSPGDLTKAWIMSETHRILLLSLNQI